MVKKVVNPNDANKLYLGVEKVSFQALFR